jgi:hypothetical protein
MLLQSKYFLKSEQNSCWVKADELQARGGDMCDISAKLMLGESK